MTTRSKKLGEADVSASGLHYVYTTPANTRTIVKYATARNGTGSNAIVQIGYTNASGLISVTWFVDAALPDSTVLGGELWSVLDPGDKIYVYTSHAPTVEFTCSGAELPII